mmetsp:Transcript_4417/g.7663  ORF Transcript_4417/g.7663 Transcript_4417/m.7663 type:complete len:210 (-) Transcript_4417:8-637(-)
MFLVFSLVFLFLSFPFHALEQFVYCLRVTIKLKGLPVTVTVQLARLLIHLAVRVSRGFLSFCRSLARVRVFSTHLFSKRVTHQLHLLQHYLPAIILLAPCLGAFVFLFHHLLFFLVLCFHASGSLLYKGVQTEQRFVFLAVLPLGCYDLARSAHVRHPSSLSLSRRSLGPQSSALPCPALPWHWLVGSRPCLYPTPRRAVAVTEWAVVF